MRAASAEPADSTLAVPSPAAERHHFDYPLLSDADGAVGTAFGVRRRLPLGPLSTRRMTFVVDVDRWVLDVIHSELSPQRAEHGQARRPCPRRAARAHRPPLTGTFPTRTGPSEGAHPEGPA